jgi:hypothetical protein
MHVDHDEARQAFLDALDSFTGCARGASDQDLLAASRCAGWTAGDLVVHVHMGLQEMLLGLVTPAAEVAGTDAASYWRAAPPATDQDAGPTDGIRFVRLVGAAYRRPSGAVRHLLPTVDGVRSAVTRLDVGAVRFQGHVLSTGDFLATWAVELAIHHLDLRIGTPAPAALRLARRTVEALAGEPVPESWPDELAVLLGAGRIPPDAAQRSAAPAFPVLG